MKEEHDFGNHKGFGSLSTKLGALTPFFSLQWKFYKKIKMLTTVWQFKNLGHLLTENTKHLQIPASQMWGFAAFMR